MLRTIAIIVAALGIALTLATLVSERTREIGVIRAVGAGRRQIHAAYLGEAALIGLLGTVAGIVCGIFLSMLLTWVVNRAFFGWDHPVQPPMGRAGDDTPLDRPRRPASGTLPRRQGRIDRDLEGGPDGVGWRGTKIR